MSTIESWIVLILGMILLIMGLFGARTTLHKSKSSAIFFVVVILVSIGLIIVPIVHTKHSHLQQSDNAITDNLESSIIKTIRIYENKELYKEYVNVTEVNFANSDVLIFTTQDGLKHAIRPGDNFVEIMEVGEEE